MSEKKEKDQTKSIIINSVDRSIDIMEYLFKQSGDTSISQISKDLDIYKSTVFRTLATLENRGYVIQNKTTEQYSIGPKMYAYSTMPHDDIIAESVQPLLQELSDKYGECVTIGILGQERDGIYSNIPLSTIESTHNLGLSRRLSNQTECYCASLGKCLLAFGENVNLEVYKNADFTPFTENTITSYEGLIRELDKVREQGYAVDAEEREIGLYCLGVPVLNGHGYAVAALSISGPKSRIHDDTFQDKIQFMKDISARISQSTYL
ncbi:MAG: IclR family transcriptional regulator [Eubacteriales bacterium]|nr:IclR family transcriptional regulator [Eubacteriales bacterium]